MSLDTDIKVDKEVKIDVNAKFDLDFNAKVDIKKDVNVDVNVKSNVEVKGNTAIFTGDVEAIGKDSFAELNLVVLTTDNLSSITAEATSAVG